MTHCLKYVYAWTPLNRHHDAGLFGLHLERSVRRISYESISYLSAVFAVKAARYILLTTTTVD